MGMLSNQRHELFAQYLASGMTQDAAYEAAGYEPDRGNASRLTAHDSVVARVQELQQENRKRNNVTLDSMTKRFNEAIDKASGDGSHPAVMAGLFNLSKLHG